MIRLISLLLTLAFTTSLYAFEAPSSLDESNIEAQELINDAMTELQSNDSEINDEKLILKAVEISEKNEKSVLRFEKKQKKLLKKLLRCSEKVITKGTGGIKGIQFIAPLIDKASETINKEASDMNLKKLATECKKYLKTAKKEDLPTKSEVYNIILNHNEITQLIIQNLYLGKRFANCKNYGIETKATIVAGGGVGSSIIVCEAPNGKRWVEFGLSLQILGGIQAVAGVTYAESINIDGKVFQIDNHNNLSEEIHGGAIVLGYDWQDYYSGGEISSTKKGYHVGIGTNFGEKGITIRSKILPLPRKWNKLTDQFL
jgi:hypothetical protein